MARMETFDSRIPVNIHAKDDSDFTLKEGTICKIEILADQDKLTIHKDADAFAEAGTVLAAHSMIPVGTFSETPDGRPVKESPFTLFSGEITEVQHNDNAQEDEPNYCLKIESLELNFYLYCWLDDEEPVKAGNYAEGVAWLFGTIQEK